MRQVMTQNRMPQMPQYASPRQGGMAPPPAPPMQPQQQPDQMQQMLQNPEIMKMIMGLGKDFMGEKDALGPVPPGVRPEAFGPPGQLPRSGGAWDQGAANASAQGLANGQAFQLPPDLMGVPSAQGRGMGGTPGLPMYPGGPASSPPGMPPQGGAPQGMPPQAGGPMSPELIRLLTNGGINGGASANGLLGTGMGGGGMGLLGSLFGGG